jgi:hypothetical protein
MFGDWHGSRSCAFFGAKCTDVSRDEVGGDDKEHHGAEGVSSLPEGEEAVMGRGVLTDGYSAGTVGKHGDEQRIGQYVKKQRKAYQQLHRDNQLALF